MGSRELQQRVMEYYDRISRIFLFYCELTFQPPPANSSRSRGVGYREGITDLRQCSQQGGIWVGSESGECRELFIFLSSGTGSSGVLT